MNVKTPHDLLLISIGLIMIMILLLFFTDNQQPQIAWVSVQAQVLDAEIIQPKHTGQHEQAFTELMVQYVYQFEWDQQSYVNRDLVKSQSEASYGLTSGEQRMMVLAEHLQTDSAIEIWVNPENPQQSVIKQAETIQTKLMLGFCLLILCYGFLWWSRL